MIRPVPSLFVPLLLLAACKNGEDDTGDTATAPACAEILSAGTEFEPDAEGPDTQIHGTSTFDGQGIWLAWNRPGAGSDFDVFIERLACDGSVLVGPVEASDSADNEIDPAIAVSGDRVLVAWTSDNGVGPHNMDIRLRAFDLEGNPVGPPVDLAAERDGEPVVGNAMTPVLAARDQGFVLSGSWGHPDAPGFQAFVVDLDRDGQPVGDADDTDLDTAASQTALSLAVDDAGVQHVAWQEDTTTSEHPSVSAATRGSAAAILADPGARPSVSAVGTSLWTAWDDDTGDVWLLPPGGAALELSLPGGFQHSARLAAVDGGAFLLWMTVESGIYNSVRVARVATSGALSSETDLGTLQAPSVYPLDLTALDGTHAFVVWAEGDSPDFRLKATILEL